MTNKKVFFLKKFGMLLFETVKNLIFWIVTRVSTRDYTVTFLIFTFVIYIIYKARRKQLVLEDGIENGIDSPPKYCVEEQPPTYQEAINIEKNPIFKHPIFSDAEISIIL